jgi:BolA protein
MERIAKMQALLTAALAPQQLQIDDDSHLHAGHAGARGGAGHYRVHLVSAQFSGLSALARHRAVYAALAELMPKEIHALSIRALTPQEAMDSAAP